MTPNLFRRAILAAAAASLAPAALRAETGPRVRRMVFVPTQGAARLQRRAPGGSEGMLRYLSEALAEEGLRSGRDVVVDYVDLELSDPDAAAIERRARAVVARAPDLILVGEDAIDILMRLTKTIPLVFYQLSGDPVALGIVASYPRPGGNVTGTTLIAPDSGEKGWELLRQLAPKGRRIGVMWREDELAEAEYPKERQRVIAAAAKFGLEYVEIVIPKVTRLAPIESLLRAAKVDMLVVAETDEDWVPDLMALVRRERIPALWPNALRVRQGGLCSASPSPGQAMRDALALVALILRGSSPGVIPVRVPTGFVTAVNRKTAREMGLAVPPAVLLRANVVIDE